MIYTQGDPIPTAHPHDAGHDLRAAHDAILTPMRLAVVEVATRVAMPPDVAGFVCPRSGLGLTHNVILAPSPGIIDAGYRGPIKVGLLNLTDQPVTINEGDRIAQLVFVQIATYRLGHVAELPASSDGRDVDGIGSTGAS